MNFWNLIKINIQRSLLNSESSLRWFCFNAPIATIYSPFKCFISTFSRLLMNNVQLLSTISENFNNGQNFSTNSQNLSTYVQNFWTLFTFRHWAKMFNNHIKLFDNDSLFDIEQNCSTTNFNVSTIMKNFRQCSETFQQSFWFNQTAKLLNINFGFSTLGQIN